MEITKSTFGTRQVEHEKETLWSQCGEKYFHVYLSKYAMQKHKPLLLIRFLPTFSVQRAPQGNLQQVKQSNDIISQRQFILELIIHLKPKKRQLEASRGFPWSCLFSLCCLLHCQNLKTVGTLGHGLLFAFHQAEESIATELNEQESNE